MKITHKSQSRSTVKNAMFTAKKNQLSLALSACLILAQNALGAAVLQDLSQLPQIKSGGEVELSQLGMNNDSVRPQSMLKLADSKLVGYRQYHLGYPVMGLPINNEVSGSISKLSGPNLRGLVLANISADLPRISPLVDMEEAQRIARKFVTSTQLMGQVENTDSDLFVRMDDKNMASLAYQTFVKGKNKGQDVYYAFLIDAQNGNILDHWNAFDKNDGNGPGASLSEPRLKLIDMGWTNEQVNNLFDLAQSIYWPENTTMSTTFCGAQLAAKQLGYDEKTVRIAFTNPGSCRSNKRLLQIVAGITERAGNPDPALANLHPGPVIASKAALPSDTGAWKWLRKADIAKLKPYDSTETVRLRASDYRSSADEVAINDFGWFERYPIINPDKWYLQDGGLDTAFPCTNNATQTNTNCVYYQGKTKGDRTIDSAFNSWRQVGDTYVLHNTSTEPQVKLPVLFSSLGTATATSWSKTVSQTWDFGLKFTVTPIVDATLEYGVSLSAETAGSNEFSDDYYFYTPKVRLSGKCDLVTWKTERWKPTKDAYTMYSNLSGNLKIAQFGSPLLTKPASEFFNQAAVAATLTIAQKSEHGWSTAYKCIKPNTTNTLCNCTELSD